MGNQEAHIRLLKYSFDKIKTIEDYKKKLNYLKEFMSNGVIDQATYYNLLHHLEKIKLKLKGATK